MPVIQKTGKSLSSTLCIYVHNIVSFQSFITLETQSDVIIKTIYFIFRFLFTKINSCSAKSLQFFPPSLSSDKLNCDKENLAPLKITRLYNHM